MTELLLRDLIDIPESVGDADFVVTASGSADLGRYVVTDSLRRNFEQALGMVGHALSTGRSQAMFLHGSFGSGKSHFMAVLREILRHNPAARELRGLADAIVPADSWLRGSKVLSLTFHMLDARSVEQAILEGYLRQIRELHPEVPAPAVHRSDEMLESAARIRADLGDEKFFAQLRQGGAAASGSGLAARMARGTDWNAETYDAAATAVPGTPTRDRLVGALTQVWFRGAVLSGEYLDLDSGLAVITRHAKDLGYDGLVLFLDELILWLSTRISNTEFVTTEGAKLNKLVESADAARPLPIVSFVARQRNLEEFLGPNVGGTERAVLADVMRSVQGRIGEIVLPDQDLPEIVEKRLLKPKDGSAKSRIDTAFAAVRGNRGVWDILLLGAQYGDAGVGSDAEAFRKVYPFSPALVATLVALSQALQRERTALRIMTELLVERRDSLRVNDLIGVSALFEPLVLEGELPDRPKMRQQFEAARDTYRQKLRPLLLGLHRITEAEAATHPAFNLDDRLVRTLLIGALVPDVPALHGLTASKLHALNFGSIASPIPGYENQIVLERMRKLSADAGEVHLSDSPDPVISVQLSSVDYDRLLELVPHNETATGVLRQLIRELVCEELGIDPATMHGELVYPRVWRGRRHQIQVRFADIGDAVNVPESALIGTGDGWRVVIDYPFDDSPHGRLNDTARVNSLPTGSRTVFWMPRHLTPEMMSRVAQLAKVTYLLGSAGGGDRLSSLAADWSPPERTQGKVYLQQRKQQILASLRSALKQAYGAARVEHSDVVADDEPVLRTLAEGLRLGELVGGTLGAAFTHLTGRLLEWSYPGTPHLPDDEGVIQRSDLNKALKYAELAAADPSRGVFVETGDRSALRRICNPLKLGELPETRYVLNPSTCWWSQHLLQRAGRAGHTETLPVRVLREEIERPEPRGFDRELQNLIIAVVAAEQQLAWYRHGGPEKVPTVQAVSDELELRKPPMPDEQTWRRAVIRAQSLLGIVLPAWRSPANLAEAAAALKQAAGRHVSATGELARALTDDAGLLGLELNSTEGRLATAQRVEQLVARIAREQDEVVLFDLVADADMGGVEDRVAGSAIEQAGAVVHALRDRRSMLQMLRARAEHDPNADGILGAVREAARHEQLAAALDAALDQAYQDAMGLIAVQPPEAKGGDGGPSPVISPVTAAPGTTTVQDPKEARQERHVATEAEWNAVDQEIRGVLGTNKEVIVSWRVR